MESLVILPTASAIGGFGHIPQVVVLPRGHSAYPSPNGAADDDCRDQGDNESESDSTQPPRSTRFARSIRTRSIEAKIRSWFRVDVTPRAGDVGRFLVGARKREQMR